MNTTTLNCNIETLAKNNVHIAITRHCLKSLMCKGNLVAMELLNNVNHTVSIEDLQQEVLLWFFENYDDWEISDNGKIEFLTDNAKSLFTCVSGYLRKFQTKHYKHQYIELDGQIVDCSKVSALADYVSMDNLLEDINLQSFMNKLSAHDKKWLEYRLQGLSNSKIALAMNVTYEKIRATEKRVRKSWNEWR